MTNKIKKENILIPLVSAILIVIFHNLKIDWYLKSVIFPFAILLVSNIILLKNNKYLNKKAYLLLIPITLILLSDIVLPSGIAENNTILNVFILPVIISIFFFLLINKSYKISLNNIALIFKIFPNDVFNNLKYLKLEIKNNKNKRIINIILGVIFGCIISFVILLLLISADDYFNKFISNIFSYNLNIGNIIRLIIYFIILFSISINLTKNKDIEIKKSGYKVIDKTIIITMLSIINFVFVLFLISEISRLTNNFLKIPTGYIYSSYAREGFFQLLFVTLINSSIIVFLMYKTKSVKESKIIKNLIFLLIIFSCLLIFNSYYRMFLYIGEFGFTTLRMQVILFLLMELILFGIIVKKIINGLKNDGLIFLSILIMFYIINLYVCNDFIIKMMSK